MVIRKIIFALLIALVVSSCGSKKGIFSSKKSWSMKKVIKQHEAATADFKTLRGKIRAGYATKDDSQSISINIRMEKDKAIWLSAKLAGIIPLAKVLITPTEVKFYEKIKKTYFVGDFRLLSDWVGTNLDFEKVQNLLTGQTIYDLDEGDYEMSETSNGYEFQSDEKDLLKKLFLLNRHTFKAEAQQLIREEENQSLTITYPEYQKIDGIDFPKEIRIIANQAGESTKIDIEYRSLEFDVQTDFPFEIPSGYNEIKIE